MTETRSPSRSLASAAYAIAGLAIVVRLLVAWYSRFTSEDFLITLRYAENLAHGHGLVFNPGERVLGTTTPLYTLFLASVSRLGLPPAPLGKLINILADAGLCLLVYRLLRGVGEERAGRAAALCVALCPLQIQWSLSGMETSLVSCCGMAVWVAFAERRTRVAYVAAALLFLLRWDGILVCAVLTLATLCRDRRLPLRDLLVFVLILLPWLLFATRYYGSPIPVTAGAKSLVYGWRADHDPNWLLRHLPGLPKLIQRFLLTPLYAVMTLLACMGLARGRSARHGVLWPLALWFALYWLAFLLSRVLLFPWYIVPPLAVFEVAVGLGAAVVWEWSASRRHWHAVRPIVVGLAALTALSCTLATGAMAWREQDVEDKVRIPLALWLKAHSRPADRIMLEPIGYIAYYSDRPVLDVVGLVSPQVLSFYRPEIDAPFLEMARAFRPEWCVLRPGELARIQRSADAQGDPWEAHYRLVQTFFYTPDSNIYYIYQRR
jgi:hypothetical protein